MTPKVDGRIARGERTRHAVLEAAVDIASAEGLEGLSIGRLAAELDASKSGVFAHFGSKEELQLATVDAAVAHFTAGVTEPALREPPGVRRLWRFCALRTEHMRTAFRGGCFFYAASAEFDARPGRVRDRLADLRRRLLAGLEQMAKDAQRLGELEPDLDPRALAFRLDAYAAAANGDARLLDDVSAYSRALSLTLATLRDAATDPSRLPRRP